MLLPHPSRPGSIVAFVALPALLILLTLVSVPLRIFPVRVTQTPADGTVKISDESAAVCPSFEELGRRLDQRIADLKPGISQEEFTKSFASRALNFDDPQSRDGALFLVGVSEGNASVPMNCSAVLTEPID